MGKGRERVQGVVKNSNMKSWTRPDFFLLTCFLVLKIVLYMYITIGSLSKMMFVNSDKESQQKRIFLMSVPLKRGRGPGGPGGGRSIKEKKIYFINGDH